MKIFGWEQLKTEDAVLVEAEMTDEKFKEMFKVKDKLTSELQFKKAIDQAYQEGRWFKNQNEAKKAMMDALLLDIQWRQRVIQKLIHI